MKLNTLILFSNTTTILHGQKDDGGVKLMMCACRCIYGQTFARYGMYNFVWLE